MQNALNDKKKGFKMNDSYDLNRMVDIYTSGLGLDDKQKQLIEMLVKDVERVVRNNLTASVFNLANAMHNKTEGKYNA